LRLNGQLSRLIFKPINLNREFSSVPSRPSGSGSSCYLLSWCLLFLMWFRSSRWLISKD